MIFGFLLILTIALAQGSTNGLYEITVYTGTERFAGTNAGVYITLFGERGVSNLKKLPADTKYFEQGSVDKFDIEFDKDIGEINKIQIGHDNAGLYSGWYLKEVRVRKYNSLKTSRFVVKRWLKTEFKKSTRHVEVTKEEKENCGRAPSQPRVVMGEVSRKGQWPWQVQIRKPNVEHHCGGTLVHPQWVLTASHCVVEDQDIKNYVITLGEHHRYLHEKTEQTFGVTKMLIHPKYNPNTQDHDITLLKLDRPALLSPDVQLACLPDSGYQLPAGEDCFVSGWGDTYPGSDVPIVLNHARLPSVSDKDCYSKMHDLSKITPNMICGGGNNRGGCFGDSGGPYVCLSMHGQFVLQGVVSWGSIECDARHYYTVFARVGNMVDWVEQNIYSKYISDY